MSDRRSFRWATTSTRLLAGTLVAIGFVVAVVTAVSVPWPTLAREPVAIAAAPAPSASVLVCTGGLLALGRELDDVGRVVTAAPQTVISGVEQGDPEPATAPLIPPTADGTAPATTVVAQPADGAHTDVAASGSSTVVADDLRGFAASACRPPLMESWLIGGSATTGAADIVLLANPGAVPATVQLTVFGASGAQVPAGGTDLVVAPATQIVVPLAGLQLGEESPVIRVTATGAPVQAALQASITRTLLPGGVDQVGAIAVPDAVQIVPGVTVTQNPGADAAPGCRDRRADPLARCRRDRDRHRIRRRTRSARRGADDGAARRRHSDRGRARRTGGGAVHDRRRRRRPGARGGLAGDRLRRGIGLRLVHRRAVRRGAEPVRHSARPDAGADGRQPRPPRQ